MSATSERVVVVTLQCDHDPVCDATFIGGGDDGIDVVRAEAYREGWARVDGRDLCPDHAK